MVKGAGRQAKGQGCEVGLFPARLGGPLKALAPAGQGWRAVHCSTPVPGTVPDTQ